MKKFIDLAERCDTVDEFIDEARAITATIREQIWFKQHYKELSMVEACKKFMNDVKHKTLEL